MVPERIEEIGPAVARALASLDAQLVRDRASLLHDRNADRRETGLAALDAMREAADALKVRLADEPRRNEPEP